MRLTGIRKKMNNRKGLPYVFLSILTLFVCWLFAGQYGIFGAKVDWISQHSVFPDYFRQQFYETGEWFPEFAGNIGGGQNIYHFSYYGLYNPVILISYLFPFVKMSDYLMTASVAELVLSVWLLYYWLGKRGFSRGICLSVTVLFLLAGPMVYHSFHQIMFINYMPFLCLSLLGVDRYLEKGRSGLYAISVFLMIMTSFYFSIGGMLVLVLYGAAQYLEMREDHAAGRQNRKKMIRHFLKDGICFLFPMFSAVLMSCILLVPTAFAILGKREGTQMAEIWSLFIPDVPIQSLIYSGYGIGLTTLIFTILITGLTYRKWHERVLTYGCVLIFSIPFFTWLLNGGLYVRSKVLIPFLPLFCYLIAIYLDKQKRRGISFWINMTAYIFTIVLLGYKKFCGQEFASDSLIWYFLLADGVLMLICFLIFWRCGRLSLLILPSVLCLFLGGCIFYSTSNDTVDRETYAQITDTQTKKEISQVLDNEEGFYRLELAGKENDKEANLNHIWDIRQWISSIYSSAYNADYQEFRKDVFGVEEPFRNDLMQAASDNPLYQKLMGVKYIVDGKKVRINENAAPIIYATDKVISEKDYSSLCFPYNQTVLMQYAVVQDSRSTGEEWKRELKDSAGLIKLPLPEFQAEPDTDSLTIKKIRDNAYHIQAKKKVDVKWRVTEEEKQEEQLLYVQFHVKNKKPGQDVAIWLEGIRNKLSARGHIYYNGNTTFTYVTTLKKGQTKVELTFGKGDYEISDMECFLGSAAVLEDRGAEANRIAEESKSTAGNGGEEDRNKTVNRIAKESEKNPGLGECLYQSRFRPDWDRTKGNRIEGTIQVENTGYCITSIPYESDFEILVDGKKTIGEKVNMAFLGFSIEEGEHKVEIIYHAPGVNAGKMLTCLGICTLLVHEIICIYIYRNR